MLSYLNGTILEKGKDFVILRVGDLGYKVSVPKQLWLNLHKDDAAALYTHAIIRDDSHELVGFASMAELEFFWKLTSVSGVGPKMAMNLLSLGPVASVRQAVDRGDVSFLSSASGVGTKSAQRVVLELKGKLVDADAGSEDEVVSALEHLGYSKSKARDAASAAKGETIEERVKQALRTLSK
jgi:Holliday junction DNA helicase RuvA